MNEMSDFKICPKEKFHVLWVYQKDNTKQNKELVVWWI